MHFQHSTPTRIERITSQSDSQHDSSTSRFLTFRVLSLDNFRTTRDKKSTAEDVRTVRLRHRPPSSLACRQSPSLRLSSSLTACGFALPPDAFIAWPTNQPRSFSFALA